MPIAHSVVGVIVNWHVSSYDGFSKMPEKTHWHVSTYRWFLKWPTDINSINSSHVETVVQLV